MNRIFSNTLESSFKRIVAAQATLKRGRGTQCSQKMGSCLGHRPSGNRRAAPKHGGWRSCAQQRDSLHVKRLAHEPHPGWSCENRPPPERGRQTGKYVSNIIHYPGETGLYTTLLIRTDPLYLSQYWQPPLHLLNFSWGESVSFDRQSPVRYCHFGIMIPGWLPWRISSEHENGFIVTSMQRRPPMAYSCQNCGASAEESTQLCNPTNAELYNKFCGVPAGKVCNSKLAAMKYTCDACGSVSADPENLCSPSKIS